MERRDYFRLPLRLTTLIRSDEYTDQICKSVNIGPSGGCLEVNRPYPPGTDIALDIYADTAIDGQKTISTNATTVYQDSHRLGIQFPAQINFYLLLSYVSSMAEDKRQSLSVVDEVKQEVA